MYLRRLTNPPPPLTRIEGRRAGGGGGGGVWVEISATVPLRFLSPDPVTKNVYFATQFKERDLHA